MNSDVQEKLDKFFEKYDKQQFLPGETLINAGEQPAGVFYLTQGIVRMYAVSAQGEEVVINVFKSRSFFPMAWVLNDSISDYYFEALNSVKVIKAPKNDFLGFLKSEPKVLFDLVKRIYKGLDGYFLRMEYLMSGNAQARLIIEMLIYAKRFGKVDDGKTLIDLKITEKDLAAQTGMTRETVSREIQKLKDKGLINFEKNTLIIHDLEGLEDKLNSA